MNKIFFLLIILGIFLIGFFIYSSQHNKKISNNIQNQTSENFNEEICKNYLENFVDVKNKKFVDKYVNHSLVLSDFRYTLWKINVTNTGNTTKKTIDNLPASGEHIFYTFYNDSFVKASESDNTIGIYSNNIDWELNKSTILQTAQETGVQIYRITDPEEFSNYDKILVLGGHKAYIDKYMPINIAKNFLNDEEKEKLLEEYNILFKVIDNPYGKNPDQKLIIFAGSDRDCTVAVPLEDNDRDRLENIKEVLAGTNPLDEPLNKIKNPDYDGDGMGDRFEYGKKLYDPSIPNDRYFININTMQFRESVFDEFLMQTFDFNPDNIYSFMGNDATFYNFKKSVEKIKREADNNDIIYISLIGHGFENGFSFSGQEGITYEEIDKLLDKINAKCIFVAVNACYEKTSLKPLSEGNGYRLVVACPVFNKYFDLVYKQNMNPSNISVGDVLDYAKVKSDSFEDKSKIRYHLYLGDKRSDKE